MIQVLIRYSVVLKYTYVGLVSEINRFDTKVRCHPAHRHDAAGKNIGNISTFVTLDQNSPNSDASTSCLSTAIGRLGMAP